MKAFLHKLPVGNPLLFKILNITNTTNMIVAMLLIVLGGVDMGIGCTAKPTYSSPASPILITIGIILAIITAIGVYGITSHSRASLLTFGIALTILTVVVCTMTTVAYIYREEIWIRLRHEMFRMLKFYDIYEKDQKCWDRLQKRNKCCGVDGYEDWMAERNSLPLTCCYSIIKHHPETQHLCRENRNVSGIIIKLQGDGCYEKFSGSLQFNATARMIGSTLLWAISFVSIAVSFILVIRLKAQQQIRDP